MITIGSAWNWKNRGRPKQEIQTGAPGEIKILENLHKEVREVHQAVTACTELLEKIWSKVHANTLQLERVKDDVKECVQALGMTDYEKAVRFLKDTLGGGRINGEEVLRMSDAAGIKRVDLNKAKRDIGVDTAVTGYGKNQKTWWFMPQ